MNDDTAEAAQLIVVRERKTTYRDGNTHADRGGGRPDRPLFQPGRSRSDVSEDGRAADGDRDASDSPDWEPPPLAEMSLGQRLVTAWVQDPVRGVVVGLFLLVAVGFYAALAIVFPRVALWLAVGGVVFAVLAAAVLYTLPDG